MQEVLAQPTDDTPFPMEQVFITKSLVYNKHKLFVTYYGMLEKYLRFGSITM